MLLEPTVIASLIDWKLFTVLIDLIRQYCNSAECFHRSYLQHSIPEWKAETRLFYK